MARVSCDAVLTLCLCTNSGWTSAGGAWRRQSANTTSTPTSHVSTTSSPARPRSSPACAQPGPCPGDAELRERGRGEQEVAAVSCGSCYGAEENP
eukprot:2146171-Rhodomonas_salina.1